MNYKNIYNHLMERAYQRGLDKSKLEGYYECHHKMPRCLGGTDLSVNLVLLTAREHFIAHVLLCKIYPGNMKLLYAWKMMMDVKGKQQKRYIPSWEYQNLREQWLKVRKDQIPPFLGNKHSEETKMKMSKSSLGLKWTSESKKPVQTFSNRARK